MENIEAKVIEDSVSPAGMRITTMQLRYPRFIHSEFMTHRVFSRNASSSRAIPVLSTIERVRKDPAEPVHWGVNQAGMQARSELDENVKCTARELWLQAARSAADFALRMHELGLHKQVANRVLEPFVHISVIVTATEWSNFFELRAHSDAQPEIQVLASRMLSVMERSQPTMLLANASKVAGWHLPYVTSIEREEVSDPILLAKMSAARCARVSYLTHDGAKPSREKDLVLYARLVGARPVHASPVEHQATPLANPDQWSRNFRGWRQFREHVEAELQQPSSNKLVSYG